MASAKPVGTPDEPVVVAGGVVAGVVEGVVVAPPVGVTDAGVVGTSVELVEVETGSGDFLMRVIEVQLPGSEFKESLNVKLGGQTEK
jgi:hypothetical protein